MAFELRPHQAKAKIDLYGTMRAGEKRIVLQAPVAWGKTAFSADIIMQGLERGRRAIFCAPALSLIDQTVERFHQYGIRDIGVMQANHPMTAAHRPVQVCSVQTLARRKIPPADIVLVDECHLQFKSVYDWMNEPEWKNVPFVGLSATPWARGMGKNWRQLIVAASMAEMHDSGWLKKLRYFAPVNIDTTGVKMIAGDYHEGQLSQVSRGKQILSDTVEQWLDKAKDRPTIAFCVDRAHAQAMQARFIDAGIPCDYIDANTDASERMAIGKRMEAGNTKVTVSVGCLIAGLDWTFVNCVLFARKTKSPMLWVQAIGRGMRLHPGQEDCLLLDCAGNQDLGHPFDINFNELDDGSLAKKSKREAEKERIREAKKCVSCGAMRQAGVRICPECGFEPQMQSSVVELGADTAEVMRGGKQKKEKVFSPDEMQDWYSSLLTIGEERGYRENWADVQFMKKFKQWPNRAGVHRMSVDHPSPVVNNWVRSQAIRFAKGRAKSS